MRFRNPLRYAGELLCICCGTDVAKGRTGWKFPICADRRPDGTRWSHSDTCAVYKYEYSRLCDDCEREEAVGSDV